MDRVRSLCRDSICPKLQRCVYVAAVRYFVWSYMLWSIFCACLLYFGVLPTELTIWLWVLTALALSVFRAYRVTCDRRRRSRELFIQLYTMEVAQHIYSHMFLSRGEDGAWEDTPPMFSAIEMVNQLPHVPATSTDPCAICLDCFDKSMTATLLPCGHQFHSNCVDCWLQVKPKCPVCKRAVTPED